MKRKTKLIISIIVDSLGMVTYALPFVGELSDFIFAPLQSWWIMYAYKSKKGATLGFIEEILPFSDFIPSCTITHFMTSKSEKKKKSKLKK